MPPGKNNGLLARLDVKLSERAAEIEKWFEGHLEGRDRGGRVKFPIYASVDLRNAGYKLAPVDTNLYPAGFNNLCNTYNQECVISFKRHIDCVYGDIKKILILAESHTRNQYYIENLRSLSGILTKDDYSVRVGVYHPDLWKDSMEVDGLNTPFTLERIYRDGDDLRTADFVPDLVVSNNDFAEGIPDAIKGARQPIDPPPELGWALRRKDSHFEIFEKLTVELAGILDIDPWMLYPMTAAVHGVNFESLEGVDGIAKAIDTMIADLRAKHESHGVADEPFVFIKSNYGTYGMGITTATCGADFLERIKKERKKMHKGKGGVAVSEVIVQEGIPTADIHDDCPVEPVIYLIGGRAAGGFYRINCERSARENLNSRGMTFSKICFHQLENRKPAFLSESECSDAIMMRVWGTLAKVAGLAAAYEMTGGECKI